MAQFFISIRQFDLFRCRWIFPPFAVGGCPWAHSAGEPEGGVTLPGGKRNDSLTRSALVA